MQEHQWVLQQRCSTTNRASAHLLLQSLSYLGVGAVKPRILKNQVLHFTGLSQCFLSCEELQPWCTTEKC